MMAGKTQFFFRVMLVGAVLIVLYLTTTPVQYEVGESINDKLSHALAFFVLSFLADYAFPGTRFFPFKILPLFAYGVLIECIQYFLPYRDFSLLDMLGDAVGIGVYSLCLPLFIRLPFHKRLLHGQRPVE